MPTSTQRLADRLRSLADRQDIDWRWADQNRRLPAGVVEELHQLRAFRLLIPAGDGGHGLDLADAFALFEAAAAIDGALGWNLCVANVGLMVVASSLGERGRSALLEDPRVLVAGGVNPGAVRATRVVGGYQFSGRVGFASGSADASWFLTAAVSADAQPANGAPPPLIGGLIPPAEVSLLDSWHVMGLRATSSCDLLLEDVFVPDDLSFPLVLSTPSSDPLRTLPLPSTLGSGLAFVAIGVAAHALERLVEIAGQHHPLFSNELLSQRTDVQIAVGRARGLVDAGRAYVRSTWEHLDAVARAGALLAPDDLARLRLSYVVAVENAITATDHAWRAAGSAALFQDEPLERCWRDVHAVGQHAFVSTRHLDRIGRITLGSPPGPGPI